MSKNPHPPFTIPQHPTMNMLTVVIVFIALFLTVRLLMAIHNQEGYRQWKSPAASNRSSSLRRPMHKSSKVTNESVTWCARLLGVEEQTLNTIQQNPSASYTYFRMGKRSGGFRQIYAPQPTLKSIQQTIYHRILQSVPVHSAATGFRVGCSIAHNVRPHLGHPYVLKTDIHDFFGSISQRKVKSVFRNIGYPPAESAVLSRLCCMNGHLPQGAPTSPALSNIVAASMDRQLKAVATELGLTYTRYADDLTFSGDMIILKTLLPQIEAIILREGFRLNRKKTRFLTPHRRKIITGVSISSGRKLTIPKKQKREIRKNVHFILTKGPASHLHYIHSSDPAYVKRLIGKLCYWRSIEPDNPFVNNAIYKLKQLKPMR